jgi:hypothetical protein
VTAGVWLLPTFMPAEPASQLFPPCKPLPLPKVSYDVGSECCWDTLFAFYVHSIDPTVRMILVTGEHQFDYDIKITSTETFN